MQELEERAILARRLAPRILATLSGEALDDAVTVRDADAQLFVSVPRRVRASSLVPLLQRCVQHLTGTIGADQLLNAARCEALSVGRRLDPTTATPDSIWAAVTEVLEQPGYRQVAEALRDEIAAMPDVREAVAHIERLARP